MLNVIENSPSSSSRYTGKDIFGSSQLGRGNVAWRNSPNDTYSRVFVSYNKAAIIRSSSFQEAITRSDSLNRPRLRWLSIKLPVELQVKLKELARLRAGWDGDCAEPINKIALRLATEALWTLHIGIPKLRAPFIVPKYDGFIQLEWHEGARTLEFEATLENWLVMGTEELHGVRQYYRQTVELHEIERLLPFYRWFIREEWLWPSQ